MPTRAGGRHTPSSLLRDYLAELRWRRCSSAMARFVLPLFFAHLSRLGVRDLRAVREEHLASYARRLKRVKGKRGRVMKPSTQRGFLSRIRSFFSFLERQRLILRNPARHLSMPKADRLPGAVPSEAQVRRLLHTPFPGTLFGIRDRAILEVLYGTGVRVSECARLDLMDLDLAERTLLVRNGKGRKDRVVPLGERAAAALDLYLREARPPLAKKGQERALFLSSRGGGRLLPGSIEVMVRRYHKAAKIPVWISPHVLRHACATHLLQGGADVRHVQEILGHKRIETTALYTRVQVKDLAQVLARSHPRERAWSRSRVR